MRSRFAWFVVSLLFLISLFLFLSRLFFSSGKKTLVEDRSIPEEYCLFKGGRLLLEKGNQFCVLGGIKKKLNIFYREAMTAEEGLEQRDLGFKK